MTSRISGWFVLSAVFIVAVFGLFFTFTERKTWPEHKIELSASDQRLIPPASTVWCEAVAIYSDHPFVAYQVNQSPFIHPSHLSRQKVSVSLKLGGSISRNSFKLKYFLLHSSILEMFACASEEGARLLVFKGEEGIQEYMQNLLKDENYSVESYSIEESSEEELKLDCTLPKNEIFSACKKHKTPSLISDSVVPVSGDMQCNAAFFNPIKVNITSDGFYEIAAINTNRGAINHMNLQLLIDRSRYSVIKSGHSLDMCSLSTACTIGLAFASDDSALVWIPEEPNAGRSTFTIRSRCKPRLAVFAILSIFLPLMFFILVAFFVRADRERIKRIYNRQLSSSSSNNAPQLHRIAASPLLTDDGPIPEEYQHREEEEELPPPYHVLYDPPPPYTCIQADSNKG